MVHRRAVRALSLLVLLVALVACHGYQAQLRASLVTVDAARDGFTAWDRSHQDAIVKAAPTQAQGESELASYRVRRQPVEAGFELAYKALAAAALSPSDVTVGLVLSDLADLAQSLKALGVPVPGGL